MHSTGNSIVTVQMMGFELFYIFNAIEKNAHRVYTQLMHFLRYHIQLLSKQVDLTLKQHSATRAGDSNQST